MPTAVWNGATIAQSADTVMVEGNHYFPMESVDQAVLRPSDTTSVCPWKGTASYLSLEVDGEVNTDAAWYYRRRRKPPTRSRVGWRSGRASQSSRSEPE